MAAQQYHAVIALDPRQAEAQRGLADILVRTNDFENARAPATTAASLLPESGQGQYLLGRALEHDKKYDEALAAYTAAARLDASLAGAHYGMSRLLREQKKDVPGALASMERRRRSMAPTPAS